MLKDPAFWLLLVITAASVSGCGLLILRPAGAGSHLADRSIRVLGGLSLICALLYGGLSLAPELARPEGLRPGFMTEDTPAAGPDANFTLPEASTRPQE